MVFTDREREREREDEAPNVSSSSGTQCVFAGTPSILTPAGSRRAAFDRAKRCWWRGPQALRTWWHGVA